MSIDRIVYKCECAHPNAWVDGDTDSVYCGRCAGLIGTTDDITIGQLKDLILDMDDDFDYMKEADDTLNNEINFEVPDGR